jgi:hypothetical protein
MTAQKNRISFLNLKGDRTAKTGTRGWQMAPDHALPRRKDENIYIFFVISCDALTATLPCIY